MMKSLKSLSLFTTLSLLAIGVISLASNSAQATTNERINATSNNFSINNQISQNLKNKLLAQRTLSPEFISFLTSVDWRFGRDNGTVIADSIHLNPNGSISGYYDQNEDHWGIEGMSLVFYNANNQPTTRFGNFRREGGRWVIIGVLNTGDPANPSVVHVLTQL